jgi:hypothetical protein
VGIELKFHRVIATHYTRETLNKSELQNVVIPAKAGIQRFQFVTGWQLALA